MIVCFIHFDYVHSLSLVHVHYFLNDTIVFLAPPLTQYPVGSRRNSPYGSAGTHIVHNVVVIWTFPCCKNF